MIRINLLPRERIRAPVPAPFKIGLVVVGVLVVVIAAAWLYLEARNARVAADIAEINEQIAELEPTVRRVEELNRLIAAAERKEQLLRQLEASRVPWAQVLLELRTIIPRDVWLTQISAASDGALVFNGMGLAYVSVARFMVNLESSPMFEGTDLTVSQKQQIGAREVVNFSVTSRLTARTEASSR